MQAALLIIGFNRPRMLKKLLSRIDLSGDRRIYISVDGPRDSIEAIKVNQVRELVTKFIRENPDYEIKSRFSDLNLGCKYGVSTAIDWAFENERSLIILEDDVVVSQEFFKYMDFFLNHFELESHIWHINGFSPLLHPYKNETSYLTRFTHVWGWATWKDRWLNYDRELVNFVPTKLSLTPTLKDRPLSSEAVSFFERNLVACKDGFDTWDFQWQFSVWFNGGLAVSPGERLSGNSGFGPTASHTKFAGFRGLNLHPRKKIPSKYRDVNVTNSSELLEELHEAIIFGIESSHLQVDFSMRVKFFIFARSFPRWIQLKLTRAWRR